MSSMSVPMFNVIVASLISKFSTLNACLGFRSEDEKQNLLKALGLSLECDDRFLWCYDLAKVLNVELIPCPYKNKNAYAGSEKGLEGMV